MKKLAVLFLIAAALLCFQREAPAAPLTDGQARTVIQQLVRAVEANNDEIRELRYQRNKP